MRESAASLKARRPARRFCFVLGILIAFFDGCPTVFVDADGDHHGTAVNPLVSCTPPAGYAIKADDCNDNDASVYPGAADNPDNLYKDENCDGIDGDTARAAFVATTGVNTGTCPINAPCATLGF